MTFNEALEELKVLAKERPCCLTYEMSSYFEGIRIQGYIEDLGYAPAANTYTKAIENVKNMLIKSQPDPAPEDAEAKGPAEYPAAGE